MKQDFVLSSVIAGLIVLSLGLVWYETIVQWTYQENMRIYVEERCWSLDVGCTMPQNPLEMMSLLGIVVVGVSIFSYCYNRFDFEQPMLEGVK